MNERYRPRRRTFAKFLAIASLLGACSSTAEKDVAAVSSRPAKQAAGYAGLTSLIGDISQFEAPIITNWVGCPEGDSVLPAGKNVNVFSLPVTAGSVTVSFIEIGTEPTTIFPDGKLSKIIGDQDGESDSTKPKQVQVYSINNEVVAWCGPSVGTFEELGIFGPDLGTKVVIPNVDGLDPYVYSVN